MKWSFLFSLGPIRASCVMSRFSSHAHHVIFQHSMQLWKTLVKPKRQSTFWLVILIYDQTKWILKGTDNILMSGYGNKCQNACRGKLNKRLIKLAGERNLISPSSRTGNVSSLVNTNSFVSAVFEPQKEYKDSGIWNLMKYVWKDIQEGTSFISLQILWQFITIDSCVRAIINVSCQQCVTWWLFNSTV